MTLAQLALALLALLLTPGPTNTLMLVAGSEGGWPRLLRLIPVELAAYLAVIVPLALLAERVAGPMAAARPLVAVAAGLWVLYLAIRLWRPAERTAGVTTVSARRVAVTTALNPKGVIMGVVLLPSAGATAASLGLLVLCITVVALLWGGAGAILSRAGGVAPGIGMMRRAASVWLAGLSVMLVLGGIGSA